MSMEMDPVASTLFTFAETDGGQGTELSREWLVNVATKIEQQRTMIASLFNDKDRLTSEIERLKAELEKSCERRATA